MDIGGLGGGRDRERHTTGWIAETALDQAQAGTGQGAGLPPPWLLWPSF